MIEPTLVNHGNRSVRKGEATQDAAAAMNPPDKALTEPNEPALTDFLDVAALQSLQDGFATLTGLPASFHDPAGRPITQPSRLPQFCRVLQSTPSGSAACRASDAECAGLARDSDAPHHACCHAGLSQFVAPIFLTGQHLGTIVVGAAPEQPLAEDEVTTLAQEHGLSPDELRAAARRLQPRHEADLSPAIAFVRQLAQTIAQLCHNAYQLRCRIDDLAAVHDVASKLAGHGELQELLDVATRQLVETMSVRASAIRLLDEDTGVLRIASVCNLSADYLDKDPIPAADSPIDRAALNGETVYVRDLRTDSRTYYRDKARSEGLVSALVTPLACAGVPLGVMRAYMGRVCAFSPFDAVLMEALASQVAAAILNARLRREARDAERLDRQVKLAADVQRRMFPARPPTRPRYEFECVYEPSFDLGGDFYDFIEFPDGEIGIVIADVVGKGVPASLIMASARAALRTHAERDRDPSRVIRQVNRRLCADTLPSEFVTTFYGVLSSDGRALRYCNAGHEPLLLLRGDSIRRLDAGGLVLGLDSEASYTSGEQALEPGDLLILVTDGVLEALNYDEKAYGRDRLHASILRHGLARPALTTAVIAQQLLWDVRRFAGLAPLADDITLVVTRVK
ncbi:MAG: SpoIIE family protein phosphatase [Phycisphaerae bacterium]